MSFSDRQRDGSRAPPLIFLHEAEIKIKRFVRYDVHLYIYTMYRTTAYTDHGFLVLLFGLTGAIDTCKRNFSFLA